LVAELLARASARRADAQTAQASPASSSSSVSSSWPSDSSSGGQIDEGCAEELFGELPASGDGQVLTQEEVAALFDGIGDYRYGTDEAYEDGDGSSLSYIRDLVPTLEYPNPTFRKEN
jgi:hypothetical protein